MEQKFNIKSTARGFFRVYVGIMSVQKPISKLRKQECDVLAEIMYQNFRLANDYKNPEDPKKWKALFSYENKQEMAENAGKLSEASFANCLTALRKHGLVTKDNYLHSRMRVYPEKKSNVSFDFEIVENVGQHPEKNSGGS